MKGYKGFKKGLICHGKQYAENTVFEEESAERCESGMYFCERPFDVLDHYGFVDDNAIINEFAEVEALDDTYTDDNKKYCTKKLRIGAKLDIIGFVKAEVNFILDKRKDSTSEQGDQSAASNTGYRSAATNTGDQSAATNTGDQSAASNTGYRSAATNTGDQSAATNTGDQSAASNTGYRSAATNTGNRSAASVEGEESVAIAIGYQSKAKGSLGCWIALAEWDKDKNHIIDFKSTKVDGDFIKADTYYSLVNGEFIEVKEEKSC